MWEQLLQMLQSMPMMGQMGGMGMPPFPTIPPISTTVRPPVPVQMAPRPIPIVPPVVVQPQQQQPIRRPRQEGREGNQFNNRPNITRFGQFMGPRS